jgi:hypothetical protein
VPCLDEFDLAVGTVQGAEDAIDAVAWITEDFSHAPGVKSLDNKIANCLGHCRNLGGTPVPEFPPIIC